MSLTYYTLVNHFSWWVKLMWGGSVNTAPLGKGPPWRKVPQINYNGYVFMTKVNHQVGCGVIWRRIDSTRLKYPRHITWWAHQETIYRDPGSGIWLWQMQENGGQLSMLVPQQLLPGSRTKEEEEDICIMVDIQYCLQIVKMFEKKQL